MKSIFFITLCVIISACADTNKNMAENGNAQNPTGKVSEESCYIRTVGSVQQDTTLIHLAIDGSVVNGKISWIPFEKDSRRGTLRAVKDGEIIKGVWTYMQEGMADSVDVEFKISGEKLYQKAYEIDESTGKLIVNETLGYPMEFTRIDCSE